MWESSKIEDELKLRLESQGSNGDALWGRYISARTLLVGQILPWIRTKEPNLTDHGPDHIRNVLDNAYHLLGDAERLNTEELYILCQSILFHDVGNIFGRKKHNLNINSVYGEVFNKLWLNRQEMALVVSIGRSHSGKSTDGTNDTLRDLKDAFIFGSKIRVQNLAAILRFADELAEGPQRTSSYMIESAMFSDDSIIHHQYAEITSVSIDLGGGRVALTYHVDIERVDFKDSDSLKQFCDLIRYIYSRIHKLDSERRYCKHYSCFLDSFKKTSIFITFWKGMEALESVGPPIELDDLFIPGVDSKDVEKIHPEYGVDILVPRLQKLSEEMG
ncbi:HD domain-containing protein [Pseudomonas psychrophila]|uniref:HD-CE domain-containing protein n=1 Tax=Pseudomonas psychrophila TaxID=122355 RepID=A0ABY0VMB8_9PSED|nr:hypothetical protein [Pseudomonas psychrophila]KMN02953.1 hypothetical protein TU76_04160 [Pseudomonas psychrophila]QIE32067.1 hypothetical protein G5J76_07285 [Pseudomonas psychrophila]WVI98617.1 hypothetical protein VR624_04325 [Pseudomonas psychrophila]SDU41960.1 hypothetical protein SAMN04490201_1527 [Pseudomonas psychrophila]